MIRASPELRSREGRCAGQPLQSLSSRKNNLHITRPAPLAVLLAFSLCRPRHKQGDFLAFMTRVERGVAKGLSVHVIMDNHATHKTPDVEKWLRRHPRVHFHFTPTSASWLNLVELLFNELSRRQLNRLAVNSVNELIAAVTTYLDRRNKNPTPFVWTASVTAILAKVRKAKETVASHHFNKLAHLRPIPT